MKKLIPLLALTIILPAALLAAPEGPKPKSDHHHDHTELGEAMDKMNAAWRKLRRQASDATQNAVSLELLATIQAAAKKSLDYTPDLAKDIPADKRAKFIEGYQTKMKEMIASLEKLGALFKAGDNVGAAELITKISARQKEGHKEYKRPE